MLDVSLEKHVHQVLSRDKGRLQGCKDYRYCSTHQSMPLVKQREKETAAEQPTWEEASCRGQELESLNIQVWKREVEPLQQYSTNSGKGVRIHLG